MEETENETDSFDELLAELAEHGFLFPYQENTPEHKQANRNALIDALTESGWVAG